MYIIYFPSIEVFIHWKNCKHTKAIIGYLSLMNSLDICNKYMPVQLGKYIMIAAVWKMKKIPLLYGLLLNILYSFNI